MGAGAEADGQGRTGVSPSNFAFRQRYPAEGVAVGKKKIECKKRRFVVLRNVSFELCFFVVDAWAHSMRIASQAIQYTVKLIGLCLSALHADCIFSASFGLLGQQLCLSALHADCICLHCRQCGIVPPLPQRTPCGLHRTESGMSAIFVFFASAHSMRIASNPYGHPRHRLHSLPQRTPCGLHRQRCTRCNAQIVGMCCELVDSFSIVVCTTSALTIFPSSSAAKATYAAIIGSPGRTIDRFFGANRTGF